MSIWPESLVHSIACRRTVIFFGSGVSMNSVGGDGVTRTPMWPDFLKSAADTLGKPESRLVKEIRTFIRTNDLLTAAEVIKKKMGRPAFIERVKAAYQTPGFAPAQIHDHLFLLDLRIAITPNFDNIYDQLVSAKGQGTVTVKQHTDNDIADALRRHERVLIKSHGSVSHPNNLIFTRSEYAEARTKHSHFYELLDALLRTYTFLFVGCGLGDPDIRTLLEDYRYRHPFGQNHYFLLPSHRYPKEIKEVLSDSLKIEFIEYAFTADHAHLTTELGKLVGEVENIRIRIGKEQSW
jgi:hypothetical protein